jgi:hypothetical protein
MPRFSDYHRTVIGYHGTRRSVAEKIVLRRQAFARQDNPGDWMGNGVYFWEYGPKQAWWWAELRRRHRKWEEPTAVVASMIRLGFCFDLLDPDNARDLKSFHDDLVQSRAAAGLGPLANQRRHKFLDKAVFEYAYAAIERENEELGQPAAVDTCRGVYVRPGGRGRLWDSSWVEHDAFIQLLVRNRDCILGSWLVDPIEEADDGEEDRPEIHPGGGDDPQGGQGIPRHDGPGAVPDHAQGGAADPGAGREGRQD